MSTTISSTHIGCYVGCQLDLAAGTEVKTHQGGVFQYMGTIVGHHRGNYVVREPRYNTTCHHSPREVTPVGSES